MLYISALRQFGFTAEGLRAYFKTGGYLLYTVGDLFSDYLRILAKRVGKDLMPKTYRKYEIARDKFYKINPFSKHFPL